jgi:hypothetical protein
MEKSKISDSKWRDLERNSSLERILQAQTYSFNYGRHFKQVD